MKTTLKVAELATFIYAILVFGSMCTEMAFYSVFDISISAYLNTSEILFAFLDKPLMYVPCIILLIISYFAHGFTLDINENLTFKQKRKSLASYITAIIGLNTCAICIASYFLEVLEPSVIYITFFVIILLLLLPNSLMDFVIDCVSEGYKEVIVVFRKIFKMKVLYREHDQKQSNKAISFWKINGYKQAKHKYVLINKLCNNDILFKIIISYSIIIIGICAINYSRARAYLEGNILPSKSLVIRTEDMTYECDNIEYLFIGESIDYLFIYEMSKNQTIVIPRTRVLLTSYIIYDPLSSEGREDLLDESPKALVY